MDECTGNESPGGLVRDGGRVGREHLEQDADEAGLLVRITLAYLAGELENKEGEAVAVFADIVHVLCEELDGKIYLFGFDLSKLGGDTKGNQLVNDALR